MPAPLMVNSVCLDVLKKDWGNRVEMDPVITVSRISPDGL